MRSTDRLPVVGMQKMLTRVDGCGRPSEPSPAGEPVWEICSGGRLPEGAGACLALARAEDAARGRTARLVPVVSGVRLTGSVATKLPDTRHAVEGRLVDVGGGAGLARIVAVVAGAAEALRAGRRLAEAQEDPRGEVDADGRVAREQTSSVPLPSLANAVDHAGRGEAVDRHRRSEEAGGVEGAGAQEPRRSRRRSCTRLPGC